MGRKRKTPDDSTNTNLTTPIDHKSGLNTGMLDQRPTINGMDTQNNGSFTMEREARIAVQRQKVADFFSKLNQTLPSKPNLIISPTGASPVSQMVSQMARLTPFSKFNSCKSVPVIDLNCDKGAPIKTAKRMEIETERQLESKAVIIIDSDDEDAGENITKIENDVGTGIRNGSTLIGTQKVGSDLQVGLEQSDMNDCLKQAIAYKNADAIVPFTQTGLTPPLFPKEPGWQPRVQYSKVVLQQYPEEARLQDLEVANRVEKKVEAAPMVDSSIVIYERKARKVQSHIGQKRTEIPSSEAPSASPLTTPAVCPSTSCPVESPYTEEEMEESEGDDLEDLWKDMSLAMEYSKAEMAQEKEEEKETQKEVEDDDDEEDTCEHSFMLRDDLGLVCKICGIIQKKIETIFDFQFKKSTRNSYYYEPHAPRHNADGNTDFEGLKLPQDDFEVTEIAIHPRHRKLIKQHQMEGFNFLVKNLVSENPSGCILAHAPGSGKTFMLIAFIQSFLAKYPSARPLVILPKGILQTWKREFKRWQVEDIPLFDFYSEKAEKRSEQLKVLNSWQAERSILFLGYKQFSNIICRSETSKIAAACQEMLLKVPSLLILDEGHTPRNEDTNVLESLAKVQTKRKVVLSGTLFQNHVREVFNILNLVRPKFLQSDKARSIVKRVLSRVEIAGSRRHSSCIGESAFYELVEQALQNDNAFNRKIRVIQDLRELTKDALHYYKGDFLDELPGLVDLTIMLGLSQKQKECIRKLSTYEKFKRSAVSTAVYMHPRLSEISEIAHEDRVTSYINTKLDALMGSINAVDGVKAKFFLNILNLAVAAQEKLLAFSQYIIPLKFLERLLVHTKGWQVGREIFIISGDSKPDEREWSMDQFNNSADAKVLFGSIKACGEGISLVGASRVVILDVHLNPSVTRQAIGRAFRPGQTKKVYTYRLVAAGSPEEQIHQTSFRKELISKMWFEWNEHCNSREFELDEVGVESCNDIFLENPAVREDIKSLHRRSIPV